MDQRAPEDARSQAAAAKELMSSDAGVRAVRADGGGDSDRLLRTLRATSRASARREGGGRAGPSLRSSDIDAWCCWRCSRRTPVSAQDSAKPDFDGLRAALRSRRTIRSRLRPDPGPLGRTAAGRGALRGHSAPAAGGDRARQLQCHRSSDGQISGADLPAGRRPPRDGGGALLQHRRRTAARSCSSARSIRSRHR